MCSLLVKKEKSCTNSCNSCTLMCHFYPAYSSESHCIQASSWELSVMFPADKSHLLCWGESMVQLQPVREQNRAHGGGWESGDEKKRRSDKGQTFLPENRISRVNNSGLCEADASTPQGETGNNKGAGETKLVWLFGGYSRCLSSFFFHRHVRRGQIKQSMGWRFRS